MSLNKRFKNTLIQFYKKNSRTVGIQKYVAILHSANSLSLSNLTFSQQLCFTKCAMQCLVSSLYKKHCQRHNGQILTKILTKFQFQNLDLALTSKSQPNISILKLRILTKASFRILTCWPRFNLVTSTKNQQQNTPASKSCLNFNFKSWPNLLLDIWTKV